MMGVARALRQLAWAAVLVSCVVGCTVFQGVKAEPSARAAPPDKISPRLLVEKASGTTQTTIGPGQPKYNYLVNDREGVVQPVLRAVPDPVNVDSVLRALLEREPSKEERDQGLRSAIPRDVELIQTLQQGAITTIELNRLLGLNGQEASLAWAQLVFTATQDRPGGSVKILVKGAEVDIRGADGKSLKAASRSEFRELESASTATTTTTA